MEFKSWIHAKTMRERVDLAVEELVAFANTQGGTVYFGVEDDEDHTVTGCGDGHDCQAMIESIYDKTRPPLFAGIEEFTYKGKKIISLSVERDGTTYATTGGKCLKRLGKNSKPYYPAEMSHKYTQDQRGRGIPGKGVSGSIIECAVSSRLSKQRGCLCQALS